MRSELHAEWTKGRTTRGARWLLLTLVVLSVLGGAAACAGVLCRREVCDIDAPRVALSGIRFGQAAVALLALGLVTSEYETGLIRTTLVALPRRGVVLLAKCVLVATATLIVGTVSVVGALVAGWLILPGRTASGQQPLELAQAATLRAAAGSVVYLVLISLLAVGVGALVRSSGAATGLMMGLLYLVPLLVLMVPGPVWPRRLVWLSPVDAGLAVQASVHLGELLVGPRVGLGILAGWAALALAGGSCVLVRQEVM